MAIISNYFDYVVLFDVKNGNPNGDPDMGNAPRMDFETGKGYVTDVAQKRKSRDYITIKRETGLYEGEEKGYDIYIDNDYSLSEKHNMAYAGAGLKPGGKYSKQDIAAARDFICNQYMDIRAFGAVLNTGDSRCGQVKGPISISIAESIDPIAVDDLKLTRKAIVSQEKLDKGQETKFAQKGIVYYGLYKAVGHIDLPWAKKSGFTEKDLEEFWESLLMMYEYCHSASKGEMHTRGLYVFKHKGPLRSMVPSDRLTDIVSVHKKDGVEFPRSFSDYEVSVDTSILPDDVEFIDKSFK